MNIVLLSGGSGKRLWPLSNDIRSKQFIKIFKKQGSQIPMGSDASGDYESMVQRVYRQIKTIDKGGLWNGGVFAYKLSYVLDRAHELIDFSDYQDLFSFFGAKSRKNEIVACERSLRCIN